MSPKTRSQFIWALAVGLLAAGAASATTLEETFDQTYAFASGKAGGREKTEAAMRDLQIEVEPSSGRIRVETLYPRRTSGWFSGVSSSVRYEIKLPASADLDVETVNGNVKIGGVTGDLDIGTTNGNVEVTAGEDMVFRTTNGGITLSIPPETQANLTARTTNGSIKTDFPITVVLGTFSRNRLEGELNGGGGSIELRTTNGSIHIEEL